jgi:hypothetical protein
VRPTSEARPRLIARLLHSNVRYDEDQLTALERLVVELSGGTAVVLVDLGARRRMHDRITLETPEHDFVGRVQVYGSDDRRAFTRLSTTAIYDIAGARQARNTTAVFPRSDFRFLELRARGVPRIDGVTISGAASRPSSCAGRFAGSSARNTSATRC